MLKFLGIMVVLWTVLHTSMVLANASDRPLHAGRTKAIVQKIKEESLSTALLIKQLKIVSSRHKIELVIMGNEFTYKMESIIYILNQALPQTKNKEYQEKMQKAAQGLADLLHDVQVTIYGDTAKLQEKLVTSVEGFAKIMEQLQEILAKHHKDDESFMNHQIRKCSDITFWAVYKLRFQTLFIAKTNKELQNEIDVGVAHFKTVFQKIQLDDAETKDEVLHLIQHLEQLTQIGIGKLEHWMNLNSKNKEFLPIVKSSAKTLSELADKLFILSVSDHDAVTLAKQFSDICAQGGSVITVLSDVVEDNVGGQEYIRSLLFDAIAVGNTFSVELEIFLSKKDVRTFV